METEATMIIEATPSNFSLGNYFLTTDGVGTNIHSMSSTSNSQFNPQCVDLNHILQYFEVKPDWGIIGIAFTRSSKG